MSVQTQSDGEQKQTKHVVADTLAESTAAVAVIEEELDGGTLTRYIIGLEGEYAEILPDKPRASRIKRHTVCKRIDALSAQADVTIQAQSELPAPVQRDIATKIAPIREETSHKRTDVTPGSGPDQLDKTEQAVRDSEPANEHFHATEAVGRQDGWD